MSDRRHRIWLGTTLCTAILLAVAAPSYAAPVLGLDQDQGQESIDRRTTPVVRPTEFRPDAAVIQFSILPSPANPDRLETTIVVQQDGGRKICVNHTSPAIIVRGYQSDADPFDPDLLSRIEGQKSGDVGELAGFNSKKLFIRPRGTDDRFDLPDEPFSVGQYKGVFRRDQVECDQELSEGDYACLDEVIRTYNCDLTRHAALVRDLRIAIALNSTQIIEPSSGEPLNGSGIGPFGPVNGAINPPSGTTGAAPSFTGSFSGSGGDGLVLVPDLIGLPVGNATSLVTSIGFVVGNVVKKSKSASLFEGLFIGTAHAQGAPSDCIVIDQFPSQGERVPVGTAIDLTCQINIAAVAVSEPSSSALFLFGLVALASSLWFSRKRSRRNLTND